MFLFISSSCFASDWRQFQNCPGRSGFSSDEVKGPYRPRWIWIGTEHVLRNKLSGEDASKWKDELATGTGKNYPMPKKLSFSFASGLQPIIYEGKVFAADLQGSVYAINLHDGSTVWTAKQSCGSLCSGAALSKKVFFASADGIITAFDSRNGKVIWSFDSGRAVSMPVLASEDKVFIGNHGGSLFCINSEDGSVIWKTERPAPINGGLCISDGLIYGCDESMTAFCINACNGTLKAERKITGQSFRFQWPVATGERIIFTTVPAICPGAEYVNDPILAGKAGEKIGWKPDLKPGYPDRRSEEDAVRKWLASDEGKLWESVFALKKETLEKDYIVACGATEGCGTPPNPPALDSKGRPVLWWATAYGSILKKCGFGMNFTMDICSFDTKNGRRVIINEKNAGGQTSEADNLYAMSIGGKMLYLRQNFRGTSAINLEDSKFFPISAEYGARDGGEWRRPVNYACGNSEGFPESWPQDTVILPKIPSPTHNGRAAPAITGSKIIITEYFAITCVEQDKTEEFAEQSDRTDLSDRTDRTNLHPFPIESALSILDGEIVKILEKGSLAPLRLHYGDAPDEAPYWLYIENGRIITTLAMAYPHLSEQRKNQLREYVKKLVSEGKDIPWKEGLKDKNDGCVRERYSSVCREGAYPAAKEVPTLHTLWGLGLYIERSGDKDLLAKNWPEIKEYYLRNADNKVLYGQMGAHLAFAKMARMMNDGSEKVAMKNFENDTKAGLSPAEIEKRLKGTIFAKFADPRNKSYFPGNPWIFMNSSQEIWNYMADNFPEEIKKRLGAFESLYPLWWLNPAPYFTRWTGDESIGTTPEIFSILMPYHRFVLKEPSEKLLSYMRSAPICTGDCHWIEALVLAIESEK